MSVKAFAQMIQHHAGIKPGEITSAYEVGARRCEDSLCMVDEFCNARVVSFEPNPETLVDCERVAKQSHGRITVVPMAASNHNGVSVFHQSTTLNVGYSSLLEPSGAYDCVEPMPHRKIHVPVITISRAIACLHLPDPQILWMDCQGSELDVLRGMEHYIHGVRAIWTEYAADRMYRNQPLLPDLDRFLFGLGFGRRFTNPVLIDPNTGKEWWGDAFYCR